MSRQALYRQYRPRTFADVVGQSRIVSTLKEAVRQGRVTHAYLFSGPRGTGKTSVARILARAVNCRDLTDSGDPCLQCDSCVALERGAHLDVIEIDAASNRGIDEIRDLREHIGQAPVMGRQRIYIIDEVHMLTEPAFNALLKTLEEPPTHVLFILATTEAHKLPITVLSRCQRYEFQRFRVPQIQDQLARVAKSEGIEAEPEALELLAEFGDGAMRDALSLLDQAVSFGGTVTRQGIEDMVGSLSPQLLEQIVMSLTERRTLQDLIGVVDEALTEGRDPRQMLRDVAREIRNLIVWRQAGAKRFPRYRRAWLEKLDDMVPSSVDIEAWFRALETVAEGEARLKSGFAPQLVLELALFQARQQLLGMAEAKAAPPSEPTPSVPLRPVSEAPIRVEPEKQKVLPLDEDDTTGDDRFRQVLELVRRERPSTHALIKEARCHLTDAGITICFAFPAHVDIIKTGPHHDLLEKSLRSIFGPEVQYTLMADCPPPGSSKPRVPDVAESESEPLPENPRDLKAEVREWFGPDVRLVGFE